MPGKQLQVLTEASPSVSMKLSFLSLPPEIRFQVYPLVFSITDLIPDEDLLRYTGRQLTPANPVSILQTCRTIHTECRDLAFQHAAFHLRTFRPLPPDTCTSVTVVRAARARAAIETNLRQIAPHFRLMIRRLVLVGPHLDAFAPGQTAFRILQGTTPFDLPELPNLTHLTISPRGFAEEMLRFMAFYPRLRVLSVLAHQAPCGRADCKGFWPEEGGRECPVSHVLHGAGAEVLQRRLERNRCSAWRQLLPAVEDRVYEGRGRAEMYTVPRVSEPQVCFALLEKIYVDHIICFGEKMDAACVGLQMPAGDEGERSQPRDRPVRHVSVLFGTADELREAIDAESGVKSQTRWEFSNGILANRTYLNAENSRRSCQLHTGSSEYDLKW